MDCMDGMDADKVLLSLRERLLKIAPPQIGSAASAAGINLQFAIFYFFWRAAGAGPTVPLFSNAGCTMKNTKVLLSVILVAMLVIAAVMLLHNEQQKRTKVRPPKPPPVKVAQVAKPVRVAAKPDSVRAAPPERRAPRDDARPEKHPKKKKDPAAGTITYLVLPAEPADKNVPTHVAREALKLVGTDPVAETIWVDAINNPALPAADRKNLIEDLNEAGFADPKNPTEAELPLIQHRLALIEKLAQTPMDAINAAAFNEAYKDLKAMATRLTQPPVPPQPEQPAMQPPAQPDQPAAQPQPTPEQPQPEQPAPQPQQ